MSSLSQEALQSNPTEEERKAQDNEESISKRSIRKLKQSQSSAKSGSRLMAVVLTEQHKEQTPLSSKNPFDNPSREIDIFESKPITNNIFGDQPINIFTKAKETIEQNIFAKTVRTVNLFTMNSSSKGNGKQELPNPTVDILAVTKAQAANNDSQQVESDDSNDIQQEEKTDPSKSKGNYSYESSYQKIFEAKIARFRVNQDQLQTELVLAIEKPKEGDSCSLMVLRNDKTGLIVYQGLLIPSRIKVEPLMGKQENAIMKVWNQSHEKDKKLQQQIVKIQVQRRLFQFENGQKCKEFTNCIDVLQGNPEKAKETGTLQNEGNTTEVSQKSVQEVSARKFQSKTEALGQGANEQNNKSESHAQ